MKNIEKTTRNTWLIEKGPNQTIHVRYEYYAVHMDAGGCWVDENQWYINFVCCCLYVHERINEPCQVDCELPSSYNIACGIPVHKNCLYAKKYFELIDSPMIASNSLIKASYTIKDYLFHIYIQGDNHFDLDRMIFDFKKFTS